MKELLTNFKGLLPFQMETAPVSGNIEIDWHYELKPVC